MQQVAFAIHVAIRVAIHVAIPWPRRQAAVPAPGIGAFLRPKKACIQPMGLSLILIATDHVAF